MKRIFLLQIFCCILSSVLFTQNKLKFSANSVESMKDNNISMNLFKDNVQIQDNNRILYADLAKQIPDSNKVILSGSVRMYEESDSLECDKLIIHKYEDDTYYAIGNVILRDSIRTIYGDTLFIEYQNNLLKRLNIKSNAIIYSKQYWDKDGEKKVFQDEMRGQSIFINFDINEQIDFIEISGMASANFNILKNDIIKGINEVSGDSMLIYFINNNINIMEVLGGVIGEFVPDQENHNISYPILYTANHINYNLKSEKTILTNNAKVIYGQTILTGGEIEADLDLNLVESKLMDSILPSVSSGSESPTYGNYMIFDLETETGNIEDGYNQIDLGVFRGDDFLTDKDDNVYINNAMFTSCDLEEPHYHFGSQKMKIINSKEQIIGRPMILYIQDFPALSLPLTILPNSNRESKSGFIMPSFGHSRKHGTWIQDFGYYYAPNDYYDFLTYIDFYDKSKFRMETIINYKKLYGPKWYNYKISGGLKLKNYNRELSSSNDFTDLGDKSKSSEDYSIHFHHNQDFDTMQYIRINYNYHSYYSVNDINNIENNYDAYLSQQKEDSQLFYSKNSLYGSLSIGASANRNLNIPTPNNADQVYSYKHQYYPEIKYDYRKSKLFGKGDKWYHNMSLSYDISFLNKYKSFSKISNSDGTDWLDDDLIDITSPGLQQAVKLALPINLFFFNLTPNLNFNEKWAIDNDLTNIQARSLDYNLSLDLETVIFGLLPVNMKKLSAIHHTMTPSLSFLYNPKSNIIKGHIEDFDNHRVNVNFNSSSTARFALRNLFQVKILNSNNEYIKRSILGLNFNTSYDFEKQTFGDLFSKISLKNKDGSEYLRINMQHDVRNIFKGRSLELKSLTTSISRQFGHKLSGESTLSETDSLSSYNSQNNDIWDAQFNISLTASYTLQDKWDVTYTNLDLRSSIRLSENWKLENRMYLNLEDMNMEYYKLQLKRSLHCWNFEFFMVPIGYNKGFGLRINISDPGLQSLRITQSTVKGWS
tara:strand:+ start:6784 stop:9759 length:2976 start_codon:yes stop_codon:yes gene_type:complete